MRNNGKKLVRLLAAALLALAMTMPLTACQVEIPGVGTININDGASDGDTAKTNGGEPGAYDFTFYSQEGNDGFGSDIGWTCPSGSQLTQEIWAWQGHTDKPALATLELHANSSQKDDWGSATFTWWYESDFVTPEEIYTGDWGLTANGEYSGMLMLDMTRTGGKRYTPGETERLIHDSFIVQVPMGFEDFTYLAVDKGTHGSYLPVQMEPDILYFYPQWE